MGIISSALAAAGDAGVQSMNQNIQQMNQQDLDKQRADMETQKQLTIIAAQKQATIDAANQQRKEQADRIAAAQGGVVQDQLAQQYAPSDAAVADADAGKTAAPLTDDQRAAINQSKAADLASLAHDPQSYIVAAMRTGDLDPHSVAQLVQQENAYRRAEQSQNAQFEHADASQAAQFAHMDASQRASQAFQASENNKNRAAMSERIQQKIEANLPPSDITDQEKQNWVHTYVTSNGSVPRSAPAYVRNSIGTWAAQMGITPTDIAKGTAQMKFDQASAVTSGHRGGSMASVEATMPALTANALQLSQKIDKTSWVPINKLMMMGEDQLADNPDLAALKLSHMAVVSEYQQVISRGGTNVASLKEAMHLLNYAAGPAAYASAMRQVDKEVELNVAGTNKVRDNLGGAHKSAATVPNPIAQPSNGVLTYDPKTGTFH